MLRRLLPGALVFSWLSFMPSFAVLQEMTAKITIRGTAEDTNGKPVEGVKLEFLPAGSPNKQAAATDAGGKYIIELPLGQYEILAWYPKQVKPHSATAWFTAGRNEAVLNVRVPVEKFDGTLEYDFLGEWRVAGPDGRGVPARVTIEALGPAGRRFSFPVYLPVDEGEKEVKTIETAPDGRFIFRIRESHIVPENYVGLVVSAESPGFLPASTRIYPALQFSETGHLYAAYPEEFEVRLKKQ